MNKTAAFALAAQIKAQEPRITATPETANKNKTNWRVRVTFRPGTPDAMSLTTCSWETWQDIRTVWAMLPEKIK